MKRMPSRIAVLLVLVTGAARGQEANVTKLRQHLQTTDFRDIPSVNHVTTVVTNLFTLPDQTFAELKEALHATNTETVITALVALARLGAVHHHAKSEMGERCRSIDWRQAIKKARSIDTSNLSKNGKAILVETMVKLHALAACLSENGSSNQVDASDASASQPHL